MKCILSTGGRLGRGDLGSVNENSCGWEEAELLLCWEVLVFIDRSLLPEGRETNSP